MKLPDWVPILGTEYTVISRGISDQDPEDHGYTEADKRVIGVCKPAFLSGDKEVLSTFVHECLHAALQVSGHSAMLEDKQEEALTLALESAIMQLLPIWSILHKRLPVKEGK